MQVSQSKSDSNSFSRTPIAAGVVLALASPALLAQESFQIEEVIVTAQKRSENLQDVPISIQALGSEAIKELNITNFKDYAAMLPSVAMTPTLGSGSSFSLVYMRGIATAGDGQATTSLPSVGMYLDELSTTTIQGNLDVHMYDIARVEALAGPQGTLYGASSQAGTIRVITNKPELDQFSSGFAVEGNTVQDGGTGHTVEGFVNIPIGDSAAIRLVGWQRSDAGWIDNVSGTRTFTNNEDMDPASPTFCGDATDCSADDITIENSALAKKDYNTLDTTGARAALRIDLGENWTVTPTFMAQKSETKGAWGDDLSDFTPGDYAVTHFTKEAFDDEWSMLGLTIEGSIGSLDVVYAASYLERDVEGSQDYVDYSYWYDQAYDDYAGYVAIYTNLHFADGNGGANVPLIPNVYVTNGTFDGNDVGPTTMGGARYTNDDRYTKTNHELRISTDPANRVRGTVGVFLQKQFHDFEQQFRVDDGLAPIMELNEGMDARFNDIVYLNSMDRTDRDTAIFGSVSFDITDSLEMTVGTRFFEPEVTVKGFFGFGMGFNEAGWSGNGEIRCNLVEGQPGWTPSFNGQADYKNKPCLNVDKGLKESDNVSRVNLSWNVSDESMVYFTWSEGYRPGGIQRDPNAGEYLSDFLTSIEFGWKTQFMDNRMQWNGAVFTQEWEDIQISFTGDNAITAVNNGPTATVDGIESTLLFLATDRLRISASGAWYDSQLDDDYCNLVNGVCPGGDAILAPKGNTLPLTADFKGNVVARYSFPVGSFDAYLQGALAYNGERESDLNQADNEILGNIPSATTLDIAAGFGNEKWALDLFIKNATGEDAPLYYVAECVPGTCGNQVYGIRHRPTMAGLKFSMDFN